MESWMESAEYLHTMSPTLGANFLSWVLPSPSLGDSSSTGPTALWINNSEMAAVVLYKCYLFTMDVAVGKSTTELHTTMGREVQTSIKKERVMKDFTINKNNLKYL